jgi:hypothetical protein
VKLLLILLGFYFLFNTSQSQYSESNYEYSTDTTLLDTLVIDGAQEQYITKPFLIKSQSNRVLLTQIIYNATSDTLDLKIMASAGWVIPRHEEIVYPQSTSKVSYTLLIDGRQGKVTTFIYVYYKKRRSSDTEERHLVQTLDGWIER